MMRGNIKNQKGVIWTTDGFTWQEVADASGSQYGGLFKLGEFIVDSTNTWLEVEMRLPEEPFQVGNTTVYYRPEIRGHNADSMVIDGMETVFKWRFNNLHTGNAGDLLNMQITFTYPDPLYRPD